MRLGQTDTEGVFGWRASLRKGRSQLKNTKVKKWEILEVSQVLGGQ